MVLSSLLVLDVTTALGDCIGLSDWHHSCCKVVLGQQRDPSRQPVLMHLHGPSMVPGVMDISTDSGCIKVIGANMVPGFILGLEPSMAPGDSVVCPDLYGPDGSMTLRHQYILQCQPRYQTSTQSLVIRGAPDIDSDPGCGSHAPRHGPRQGLGSVDTMAMGGSVVHSDWLGPSCGMSLGH